MRPDGETRVAVVTGAAAGIGLATARRLAQSGMQVAMLDLDGPAVDDAAATLRSEGHVVRAFHTDVTRVADVQRAFGDAWLERIDVLVNNAGIALARRFEEHSDEDWDRVFAINVKSAFLCTRAALPALRRVAGNVVNVSSMTALVGQPCGAGYTASKAAMLGLTKALALELGPDRIRVNCVCPAGVDTPMMQKWAAAQSDPAAVLAGQASMHLLGRMATPDEIADSVAFLASSAASFLTGVILPVEGGATLGYRRV